MIEELIRRLQERKLSEAEEEKLILEMKQAKEVIIKNTIARQIEEAKQKEIAKDEDRMKMLKIIDEEISDRKKKNRRLEKTWNIISIILTFFAVGTAIGNTILVGMSTLPFVLEAVIAVLGVFVPIGLCVPIAKMLAKSLTKKSKINDIEIAKLTKEKELLIDDVKVDLEKLLLNNIKLTNLDKNIKFEDIKAYISGDDLTI